MNINDFTSALYPILLLAVTTGLGYIGNLIRTHAPIFAKKAEAELGLANYNTARTLGVDIFKKIEEDTRLGDFAGDKLTQFTALIKKEIPGITDSQVDLINKAIAGEFNKDKAAVIKAITPAEPVIEKATAIKKYFADDGVTELVAKVPVEAKVEVLTGVVPDASATVVAQEAVAPTI